MKRVGIVIVELLNLRVVRRRFRGFLCYRRAHHRFNLFELRFVGVLLQVGFVRIVLHQHNQQLRNEPTQYKKYADRVLSNEHGLVFQSFHAGFRETHEQGQRDESLLAEHAERAKRCRADERVGVLRVALQERQHLRGPLQIHGLFLAFFWLGRIARVLDLALVL